MKSTWRDILEEWCDECPHDCGFLGGYFRTCAALVIDRYYGNLFLGVLWWLLTPLVTFPMYCLFYVWYLPEYLPGEDFWEDRPVFRYLTGFFVGFGIIYSELLILFWWVGLIPV